MIRQHVKRHLLTPSMLKLMVVFRCVLGWLGIVFFYVCWRVRKHTLSTYFTILLLCGFGVLIYASQVQAEQPSEYRLKVAFLYNFAAYTEWPERHSSNLEYCIYGDDPFGEHLQHLRQKKINEQEIVIKYPKDSDDLHSCQVVFIARSAMDNLSGILNLLDGKPILTIADTPGSCQQGVVLNMAIREAKVIFEANIASAKKNGLKLSAQLLRFATEVHQ